MEQDIAKAILPVVFWWMAAVLSVTLALTSLGAQATFPAQDRGSGFSWDWQWSNPNQNRLFVPPCLIAGMRSMDPFAGSEDTSIQLRFDVRALNGYYATIHSATVRLTQRTNLWDGTSGGTLRLFRLSPANAGWNSAATWGYLDGSVNNPWAGGVSGGKIPDIDYGPALLASTPYRLTAHAEGTKYDLVIAGDMAAQFISQWASGQLNEGFLIYADGSLEGDNRILFYCDGPQGPQLYVDYTPKASVAVAISRDPTNLTVLEQGSATFAVAATGAPPLRYRWLRDGVPVPGATNRDYTLAPVQLSDNGTHFSVQVTDGANTVKNSGMATLAVLPDTNPPVFLGATNMAENQVLATFSKPLSPETARVTAHYDISGGVKAMSAELGGEGTTVVLTTEAMPYGTLALSVSDLRDTTVAGNRIAPHSTATFVHSAKASFPACNRASGVSWDKTFSNAEEESHLAVGEWSNHGDTSAQLRFDVKALQGRFSRINSATLRLTIGYYGIQPHWWDSWLLRRVEGTLEVYRLSAANAGWNNVATFGTIDGRRPWAGGESGGLTPGVDYRTNLLARLKYSNEKNGISPTVLGTVYEMVIPGALATSLLDDWCAGPNEGLLLRAEPNGDDNRGIFIQDGPNGPRLIVDYRPSSGWVVAISQQPANVTVAAGEPATFCAAASGVSLLYYQWLRDGKAVSGATVPRYTLPLTQPNDNGARFALRVTDQLSNSAVSAEAVLKVVAEERAQGDRE